MGKHTTIAIIGSTKFYKEMKAKALELEKKGFMVFYPTHRKEEIPDFEEYRDTFESIYMQKIRRSDEVLIFDKNGYIGEHMKLEIAYAEVCKIPMVRLSELEPQQYYEINWKVE